VLVTLVALAVVFVASRRSGPDDHVAAGDSPSATTAPVASAGTAPATTTVRVIELAESLEAPPPPPSTVAPTTAAPSTPAPTTPPPTTTVKRTTTTKPKPTTTVTTLPTTTVLDTAPPATAPPTSALVDPGVTTIAENVQDGRGTFHRYDNTDPRWGERPCAHRTLPKGTVVTVINTKTGASTWCIVKDRGPYGNAIIDLDEEQFVEIAPVGAGVINVRITW
jgi:Lytic transglycolase